jgi:hypothetical protein
LRLNEQQYKRECRAQTEQIEEELERLRTKDAEQSTRSQLPDSGKPGVNLINIYFRRHKRVETTRRPTCQLE